MTDLHTILVILVLIISHRLSISIREISEVVISDHLSILPCLVNAVSSPSQQRENLPLLLWAHNLKNSIAPFCCKSAKLRADPWVNDSTCTLRQHCCLSNIISSNSHRPRILFNTINSVVNPCTSVMADASVRTCENFLYFFTGKVSTIRQVSSSNLNVDLPTALAHSSV